MWTRTRSAREAGRSRRSLAISVMTARRSGLSERGTVAGVRARPVRASFDPFVDYCRARLVEDPHLWAMTLFDEVVGLGFVQSYPTFTRQLRLRSLRPHCERATPRRAVRWRSSITRRARRRSGTGSIFPDPPASWGWGANASLFVGALAHSGQWRGCLAESKDQPHTIDALDQITRKLGGLTRVWRFDRMATVCYPSSGRVTPSFAGVAKHYGVSVAICPPRRGNRKGVVEKANDTAAQRWWRTLPDDITIVDAQASLDRFCAVSVTPAGGSSTANARPSPPTPRANG